MRISDADRQRVVEELGAHAAAGRLDMDAYAGRLQEVWVAQTLADLDHARRDLPFLRLQPSVAGHPPGRSAPPVMAPPVWRARLVVLLAVLLVVTGVVLALAVQAVWIAVLAAGWLIGIVQGLVLRARR